ncbi:MAG: hypothetical protein ACHP9Y_02900 [Gammaproteobacteria bacterium]
MVSKDFEVSSLSELLVMHRIFREAKFCLEPDDTEISASPIVAKLYLRLMDALISSDAALNGESAQQRWNEWLTISESRAEWRVAIGRAKMEQEWSKWSYQEKSDYVSDLLSPFIITKENIDHFIEVVNQHSIA